MQVYNLRKQLSGNPYYPMTKPIYLDNNATTQVDSRVVDTVLDAMGNDIGNASSKLHRYGNRALELVENARKSVAALAQAEPQEILFTSGATESINLMLRGLWESQPTSTGPFHVVTIATEHSATLDTLKALEKKGARGTVLPVKTSGLIDLDAVETVLRNGANVFTISHANNEIGTIQPIESIARLCREHGALLHVDAAQSLGKIPVRFKDWQADLMSVSGHKLYGPKGIGCLIIRQRNPPIRLVPQITGGGQERGIRSGTLNVPGIAGLGKACEIAKDQMEEEALRTGEMRDSLKSLLAESLPGIQWNGTFDQRLPGNLNFSIPGIQAELLLGELRNSVAISSGSACHSRANTPSHVLEAIGVSPELAFSSLRACVGRFNSNEEIRRAADIIINAVKKIRA